MVEIMRRAGTLEILIKLKMDKSTFTELLPLTSRKTLADRLKELEDENYIERVVTIGRPIIIHYEITSKGKEKLNAHLKIIKKEKEEELALIIKTLEKNS